MAYDFWGFGDSGGGGFNVSDTSNIYNVAASGSGINSADGAGAGFDWSGLLGLGASAGAGYLNNKATSGMTMEQIEKQGEEARKTYEANKAIDEKYYQEHGKQLSDAYNKYAKYYKDPTVAENNPTNIFGLLTPRSTTGPLANGW